MAKDKGRKARPSKGSKGSAGAEESQKGMGTEAAEPERRKESKGSIRVIGRRKGR